MAKRFLITSAIEETWRKDLPVLFLGEWCRRYDRMDEWKALDAEVLPYHWDDREKLFQDYLFLQNVYEEFLHEFSNYLNRLHGLSYSERYWRILIGPWLGCFIQTLFDRWWMLRQAIKEQMVLGAKIITQSGSGVVPNDMENFQTLFLEDRWNEAICGEILGFFKVPVEFIASPNEKKGICNKNDNFGFKHVVKRWFSQLANKISGALSSEVEFFFFFSYLPVKQDFLLQLKLGQFPKLWRQIAAPMKNLNYETRQLNNKTVDENDFVSFARVMINRHMPIVYLEGYKELADLTHSLPWPKKPKVIFTSNSYWTDDVFKAWAAAKAEENIPFVIGQHGGNYGLGKWSFSEEHQIAISDRFLSWGWKDVAQPKIIPVGCLKNFGRISAAKKDGWALLVEMSIPRVSYHMYSLPIASQWLNYFDDQCRFVRSLPHFLQEQLLVRLYRHDYGWCQKQRWQSQFPYIRIDDGFESMVSSFQKARLFISTYNATTFLESMSLNIPTLIFWNPAHWELRKSAEPDIAMLSSAGIFHSTPESAAGKMVKVWDDIDAWWLSDATQMARRKFCEKYAFIPDSPLASLRQLFAKLSTRPDKRIK